MAKDCCRHRLLYRRFYLVLRTVFIRHTGNSPSDSNSNTHTHHAGMHFGYFVKGKSMLYGGHGVKREEFTRIVRQQPKLPALVTQEFLGLYL